MADFARLAAELKESIDKARKEGILLAGEKLGTFKDFRSHQREQLRRAVFTSIAAVAKAAEGKAGGIVQQMQITQDAEKLDKLADELLELAAQEDTQAVFAVKKPRLPWEIHDDVTADIGEVKKCMDNQCYRSAVILCGRILETALHRKYFDVTKNDLLEKSPGMGLGNLIAKLSENGVALDPGLGNQIHLINQVRVHSVHQKQDAFKPSPAQAQAIVLYTMDILEKLFA